MQFDYDDQISGSLSAGFEQCQVFKLFGVQYAPLQQSCVPIPEI